MDIEINGKTYSHVKTRHYSPVSIYKGNEVYLRLGPSGLIHKELALHKQLLQYGFPVAQLLAEGDHEGSYYYIEEALGATILGKSFWEDINTQGEISEEHFTQFLLLAERFAQSQLKTAKLEHEEESFYLGIHTEYMLEELPGLKEKIIQGFEKAKAETSVLPSVITHGDFGPFNFCEKGIIDFDNAFYGQIGYDLVCAVYFTYNFPKQDDTGYEFFRVFEFTPLQIHRYFTSIDSIFASAGLPNLSGFIDNFIFCRTMWAAVRMQKYPKLQAWRYKQFERVLEAYLKNESLISIITS